MTETLQPTTQPPTSHPLLELREVWKSFPGVTALKGVSLALAAGEVHAVLGENGAGKSTLMSVASGSIAPDSGSILFGEKSYGRLTPAEAQGHGLAIVHQHPAVLPDLTVAENLALAAAGVKPTPEWMREQLRRVDLRVALGTRLEDLTVAQRQLLELTKAIAANPRVLILDEPTAPLGADRVATVFELVREATRGRGRGHLHLPPAGRGAPDRRPGHRHARRRRPRQRAHRRDVRRRDAPPHRRPRGGDHLPQQARGHAPRRRPRGGEPLQPRLQGRRTRGRAR